MSEASAKVNVPPPASIVSDPPGAVTIMEPLNVVDPEQANVARTMDSLGSPSDTTSVTSVKVTDCAVSVAAPPCAVPSAMLMPPMLSPVMIASFCVPAGIVTVSPF